MWTLQNIKSESPIHAFTPLLVLIRKNFKFIMVKPQVICEGNWPHPTLLCIRCYIEDTKLVEIMIVICKSFNFVKDNQCFNGFSFVKSKLKNQLTMHPDVVIQMISLYIYIYFFFENFPYDVKPLNNGRLLKLVMQQLLLKCYSLIIMIFIVIL